jgi:hypothetical protein
VANERSMAGGTAVVWCGVACVSWESSLGACVFGVSVIALAVSCVADVWPRIERTQRLTLPRYVLIKGRRIRIRIRSIHKIRLDLYKTSSG